MATYAPTTPLRKFKILAAGTIGAVLPDVDAISMWSRFDGTFGRLFGLEHSGKIIYGSKFWYSHHAFFHSLLASLLFGALLVLAIYLWRKYSHKRDLSFFSFLKKYVVYFVAFVLGYWAHLAGDLPTPASVWDGIALYWPADLYAGGSGKIWWWNNYDVFLLIVFCIAFNLIVPALWKKLRSRLTLSLPSCWYSHLF